MKSGWETARGKSTPKVERPWMGYTEKGVPYQKPRCWSDPEGCQRYVEPGTYDFEHHLCKDCVRAIETNWQVTPGMVSIVMACIRLDRQATFRIRSINKDDEFIRNWNKTQNERVGWLLKKLGNNPDKIDKEAAKKLSINYFKGAIVSAGGTAGQGSGMGVE